MKYIKLKTITVNVGDLTLGGEHPIRVQSMITADTMDTDTVVQECIGLINVGCELIRITAPSIKEARHLEVIKQELKKKGYSVPLCADIHYTPSAAEIAARIVEKVRINPGNYSDKKKFEYKDYSDDEYNVELEKIRDKFLPLVKVCKEYGTALRIGTNHGSLSDRILSKYGDTALGMVESAMEFVRICEDENFRNIVISMKASNPLVMIEAYRLLVSTMIKRGMLYPLHLGVTEAGDGEDGRIKSAIGIGTLLEDGIGDTVRVSLTEPSEYEIPVAKKLVEPYNVFREKNIHRINDWLLSDHPKWHFEGNISSNNIIHLQNKKTTQLKNIGKQQVPVVINSLKNNVVEKIKPAHFFSVGYTYNASSDKWNITDFAADYVDIGMNEIDFEIPVGIGIIQDYETWKKNKKKQHYPLITLHEIDDISEYHPEMNFVEISVHDLDDFKVKSNHNLIIIVNVPDEFYMAGILKQKLDKFYQDYSYPLIFKIKVDDSDEETFIIKASSKLGYLFTYGYGNGIMFEKQSINEKLNVKHLNSLMFNILQGLRERISKTEYIACPSCGRTLFDLQETTKKIKEKTSHLKGLKIGIMGCIVNGPGEMADADFGYVGTGIGKISLYKGHQVVKRNIPEERAVEELISLIKEHGMYKEAE